MSKHLLNDDDGQSLSTMAKKAKTQKTTMSISEVSKTLFNPLLRTKEEVTSFLRTRDEDGTAHVFRTTLLLLKAGRIHEIDISEHPESYFFQDVDLNTLSETISARIQFFPALKDNFEHYTVVSLTQPYLEVDLVEDIPTIIALSVRKPTYYDFCVGNKGKDILCYARRENAHLMGMSHSGDQNHGETLLHTLTFNQTLKNDPFALFVSGYQLTNLVAYQPQNPAVMIADHTAKMLYVVPIPLDEVSIGKATVCAPLVARRRGTKIGFGMLPSAATAESVMASGAILQSDVLERAISREVDPIQIQQGASASVPAPSPAEDDAMEVDIEEQETGGRVKVEKLLYVLEQGCSLPSFVTKEQGTLISFRQGITIGEQAPMDEKAVVLPVVLGNMLEGTRLLALGKPFDGPNTSLTQYHNLYNDSEAVIVVVSDRMTDSARLLNPTLRCNALFVIESSDKEGLSGLRLERIEELLNKLNINAVTALAGPQSIVVAKLGDRYYFYRGIRWTGFLVNVPKYGEDVTDLLATYVEWAAKKVALPWKRIAAVDEKSDVYFSGKAIPFSNLFDTFNALTFPQLEEYKLDILDTLSQLQSILLPKDMIKFTQDLTIALKTKTDDSVGPIKKKYMEEVKKRTTFMDRGKSPLYAKLRKAEKDAKVQSQWLIDALGKAVSSKTSSTRGYDLKMMIRKAQISGNVSAAQGMTYDQLGDLLEDKCSDLGVIIGNVDTAVFTDVLRATSQNKLLADLQNTELLTRAVCTLDGRVMNLNGLDASVIFPMAQKYHNGPLAGDPGALAVAVPYGLSTSGEIQGSAMAWPCFDEFNDIESPFNIQWVELTNTTHISAVRILQRSTISNAIHSRTFQLSPAAKELGYLLVHCVTDLMTRLAALRSAPPKSDDASDTTTRIMRGLWGYTMTLLASGAQPMSMAWQLSTKTQSIEVPEETTWWLYSRIVQIYPYTAWPRQPMRRNVATILAKVIRKQITSKVTEPMVNQISNMEKDKVQDQTTKKNIQLAWAHLAVDTLKALVLTKENAQDVAKRLLETVPESYRKDKHGFGRILRTFVDIKNGTCPDDALSDHIRTTAANIQTKRSGFMGASKTAFFEACSKPSVADRQAAKMALTDGFKQFALEWGLDVQKLHLQNKENIENVMKKIKDTAIDKGLLDKINGDADRRRTAWVVGRPLADEDAVVDFAHLLPFILTGSHATSEAKVTGSAVVKTPKILTLEEKLRAVPDGHAAAALLLQVQSKVTTLKQFCQLGTQIPRDDFEILMGAVGITLPGLKDGVKMYLEGWMDSVQAEKDVVNMFLKFGQERKEKMETEKVKEGEEKTKTMEDVNMTG